MNRLFRRPTLLLTALFLTALAAIACGSGSDDEQATAGPRATPVIGAVQTNPNNGGQHVATGIRVSGYTEVPATSGPHWIDSDTPANVPAPARWGIYDFALPDEVLVHNLEHGGVGIHYDCPDGCADLVAQLEGLVPANPSQYIVSPYSGMFSRIVITAWRHSLYLNEFDEAAIANFIRNNQDNAPESVKGNTF